MSLVWKQRRIQFGKKLKKNQPLSYCTKVLSSFSCKYTICFAQVEAVIYIGLQRPPRPLMGLPPSVLPYVLINSLRSFVHTVSTYSEHLYECLNAQNVQKHSAQCKHSHRSLYVVNRRANEDLCY